ncbi:MAG: BON domain-containing protein [Thermosynechococcaceae cyanobacterium]
MNTFSKTRSFLPLLFSIFLMATISACTTAKTASDSPSSTDNNKQATTASKGNATQNDAQSETRRKQLNSDIQAREQRNNMGGGNLENRADSDLASEVRSKLEANLPSSKLTVKAHNADITVSGVVTVQAELDKIKPLAMEIKGVKTVIVNAALSP